LRIGFAEMVAYRAEFLVWILTTNMPLVMMALWSAVAAEARWAASASASS
jgi:ABC-2 type transport system permease protein